MLFQQHQGSEVILDDCQLNDLCTFNHPRMKILICRRDFTFDITKKLVVHIDGKLIALKNRYCVSNMADS
jgi:hypothetical protein